MKCTNYTLQAHKILILLIATMVFSCAGSKRGGQEDFVPKAEISFLSNVEIDLMLAATSRQDMTISQRINHYSEKFLDMDYSWTATGDSPYALLEAWPLVNFGQTNCMVFCEHVLALAISDSWDNFFNNLQQIRYRDGLIGMRTRNHYTMADWLPENDWLLEDVTRSVGLGDTRTVTRTISHENFFRGKGITDLRYVLPDREVTIPYVPKEALDRIEGRLRVGDIGAIIYADKTDIFSAHMFMIAAEDGIKYVREATTRGNTTFDTPYAWWFPMIEENEQYIGISVMRVRKELNTPGRIILPSEIPGLKRTVR
ncbi:N-acetylmuramoyl-L-alanine amidase-like domain-containing protein [candidate division KSB1 bacterium]